MINTYDREMIARHQHEELLRTSEQRRMLDETTGTDRRAGFFSALLARLRGTAASGALGTAAARA